MFILRVGGYKCTNRNVGLRTLIKGQFIQRLEFGATWYGKLLDFCTTGY